MKIFRKFFAILTLGLVWYLGIMFFFVVTGAQNWLANPEYQSEKFIRTFLDEPLPRAFETPLLIPAGLTLIGILVGSVFLWLNDKLPYGWFRKGIAFGVIQWVMMTPWFEFYLPYNVMLEPIGLVFFEMLLWAGVTLVNGLYVSFLFNFKQG